MSKLLLTFPLTLAAAAVLSTAPIPMSATVSEAKEITLAQKQGCDTNARVCGFLGCQGRNPTTGAPIKGAQGLSGAALDRCMNDCGKKHDSCLKTGNWKNKVIGGAGGTDVKTKPGGVVTKSAIAERVLMASSSDTVRRLTTSSPERSRVSP